MSTPFRDPAPPGQKIEWAEYKGSLLLFKVTGAVRTVTTTIRNAKTGGYDKDALPVRIVVLDGPKAGEMIDNGLIFPTILLSQVDGEVGSMTLGRLNQGVAKPGQDPPWILDTATDADKQVAMQFLSNRSIRQPAPAAAAPPPPPAPPAQDYGEPPF